MIKSSSSVILLAALSSTTSFLGLIKVSGVITKALSEGSKLTFKMVDARLIVGSRLLLQHSLIMTGRVEYESRMNHNVGQSGVGPT